MCVLDFAENYACLKQDEIQSADWVLDQITVNPTVVPYNCPDHDNHIIIVQEATCSLYQQRSKA